MFVEELGSHRIEFEEKESLDAPTSLCNTPTILEISKDFVPTLLKS